MNIKNDFRQIRILFVALMFAVVTACGGGGGGGGGSADDDGGGNGSGGDDGSPEYSFSLDEDNGEDAIKMAFLLNQLMMGLGNDQSVFGEVYAVLPGLVAGNEEFLDCASGSMAVVWNDNDGSNTKNAGDTFDIDITGCNDPNFEWTLSSTDVEDGRVLMTLNSTSGNIVDTSFAIDATLDFTNLLVKLDSAPKFVVNGTHQVEISFSFDDTVGDYSARYSGATLDIEGSIPLDSGLMEFDLSLKDYALAFEYEGTGSSYPFEWNFNGLIDVANITDGEDSYSGSIKLETTQPFSGDLDVSPFASAGRLKLSGLDSSVSLTAIGDDQVRLELDLGDDGSVEESETVNWYDVFYDDES